MKKICDVLSLYSWYILEVSTSAHKLIFKTFLLVLVILTVLKTPYSPYWRSLGIIFTTTTVRCNSEPQKVNNVWLVRSFCWILTITSSYTLFCKSSGTICLATSHKNWWENIELNGIFLQINVSAKIILET